MAYFPTNVLDNQIKALPTVDTASGSVATFDTDMTENLVEVKCQIVAQQSGSGTPSPDNVRPILTFDDLTLYHNDINLWNEIWELGTYSTSTGEKVSGNYNIRSKSYIKVNPNTLYRFVTPANAFNVMCYDENKSYINFLGSPATFNTPPTCHYITFYLGSGYGTTYNHDTSINYPYTDTDYHAFNGAYIPFGQTVAKGVLNVGTGKLEVTHGVVDLGTLNFAQGFSGFYTTGIKDYIEIPTTVANSQLVSSIYSVGNTANSDQMYIQFNALYLGWVVFLPSTSYATASDFKTAMNGIPLVYKLKEPTYIQLSAQTITALLNENNIWCDTNGNTEVKYLLTVGKAIS